MYRSIFAFLYSTRTNLRLGFTVFSDVTLALEKNLRFRKIGLDD